MPYADLDKKRDYQKKWLRERRQHWLEENGPCTCGSTEDLEVHHTDPKQKVSHRIWSWSEERRQKELSKCVVKCHECHVTPHYADKRKKVTHGTQSGYTYYKCRCVECKKAHSISTTAWAKRKRRNKQKAGDCPGLLDR